MNLTNKISSRNAIANTPDCCGSEEPAVSRELNRLGKALDESEQAISQLQARLAPVTRCVSENKCETSDIKCAPEEVLSPLASQIRSMRYGVERVTTSVRDTLRYLEV